MDHAGTTEHRENAAALFKALSSPVRIGIVLSLAEQPCTVGRLVDALGVSQPLVSQHLKVLRDHCLVDTRRQGREVWYSLMDDHVAHIVTDAIAHVIEHDPHEDRSRHQRGERP